MLAKERVLGLQYRHTILGLHRHAIEKNNSKTVQLINSRNYNVIGGK